MSQQPLFQTPTPLHFHGRTSWLNQLPQWLIPTIQNQPTRTSPNARLLPCPRCHQLTLKALDTALDHCTETTVDILLLTNNQELQALTQGRTTHTLKTNHDGITIHQRNKWTLATKPANNSPHPITPNHKCREPIGHPIPWQLLYPQPKETHHEPPF